MIESAIIATCLLREGDEAVEDFRRCSYKGTLRILRDRQGRSEFFRTAAGQRVLQSALDDLALEDLSKERFAQPRRNHWRLQGKSLNDIFGEVAGPDESPFVYGIPAAKPSTASRSTRARSRFLASTPEADRLALAFYEDVAEILDIRRVSPSTTRPYSVCSFARGNS